MNSFEKCIIEEIDMLCDSYYNGIRIKEEEKLQIANNVINNEDNLWELFNTILMDYIENCVITDKLEVE